MVVELLKVGEPALVPSHLHRVYRTIATSHCKPLGFTGATTVRTDGADFELDVETRHWNQACRNTDNQMGGSRSNPTIRLIAAHKHVPTRRDCSTGAEIFFTPEQGGILADRKA